MSKFNRELSFLPGNHCAKPESIQSDVFNNLSAQVALLPRLLESIYFLCILPPEKWVLGVPVWDARTWKHRKVTCRQERKKQKSPRGITYQAVLSVVLEVCASFWAWTEQCDAASAPALYLNGTLTLVAANCHAGQNVVVVSAQITWTPHSLNF